MGVKSTPQRTFPYHVSKKDLKKSYELRLAAQFGDRKAKEKLAAYNRRQKELRMEAGKSEWVVAGHRFNRYKMMNFIVSRTANGELLSEICQEDGMPSIMQVYSWFENHPDFEKQFMLAEKARGHMLGDEVERIARNTDRENVSADKLKTEVLGKAAARLNSRFQDRQVVEQRDEYSSMTPEQIRARISAMIQANPELAASIPAGTLSFQETAEPIDVPVLPNSDPDEMCNDDAADAEPIDQEVPERESQTDF